MYTKKNTRVTFRSNKRVNFKRNNNFSNGKIRNKGNVTQQYNKYLKLAKEAASSGDKVQTEYYYQFTDHFYRLMVDLGIAIDDHENFDDRNNENLNPENQNRNETNENQDSKKDENEVKLVDKVNKNDEDNNVKDAIKEDNIDSIESIPFISQPAKKKVTRKKTTSA